MQRTVSVIVPAHNAQGTIQRALTSAWEQTRRPDEIVVADDGSTDGTAVLADRAGATVLRLPKANGAVGRNRAVEAATGELLLFLDADDAWEPGKVAAHLDAWTRNDASFVFDYATRLRPDGVSDGFLGQGPEGPVPWEEFLNWETWTSGSSFSVPRGRYLEMGGFREELVSQQDVDFWVRCSARFGPAHRIGRPLTRYQLSPGGVSKNPTAVETNLRTLLSGWDFVAEPQKEAFFTLMALTAAGFTPFPRSLPYFGLARWPVHRAKFWRALARSIRNAAA